MLSHAKQKNFAKAREVFSQIQQNNPAVKPSVVESMLAIFAMEREPEAATAFFTRIPGLIEDGKASVKMFNLLLRVYDRSAYMTRLWLAYRSMRERFQIEPDAETFAILTNAFARRGEFERAYAISEHALKKGVELDADTVCFQLVTAAKKRDYQWTKIFLQQLKKRLVRPTVQVRAAFVYAKTLNGEGHQALKEAEKLESNREVLKGILTAASLVGSASVMEAAFEELLKQFPHGPDRSTVKILANGYRMLGDFQMLSKVVQQAERDGLRLDNEFFSMRLHANCELDLMDEVAKDLKLIKDQQIDGEAYQALGKLNLRTTRMTTFKSKYSENLFQMTIRAGQRVDSGLGKKWITPLEPMHKSEGKVYSQRTLDALFNTKLSAPTAVRMFQDDTESAIRALTLFTFKSSQEAIQEDTLKAVDDSRQPLTNDGSERNDLRVLVDSTS
ncbi:hypothetical protein NDN08_005101 [Rhodosorus marinus]|uniref:Pentacotripeptide-repeat region of PRORP domain-containing protein n=1 Tax=Rhodosorus marinus TaxID=101924 RepID=A0AAV8V420_9RHOD|nr:hypothetical protein NDN08_005101 [Rhodosorus marinus]